MAQVFGMLLGLDHPESCFGFYLLLLVIHNHQNKRRGTRTCCSVDNEISCVFAQLFQLVTTCKDFCEAFPVVRFSTSTSFTYNHCKTSHCNLVVRHAEASSFFFLFCTSEFLDVNCSRRTWDSPDPPPP